MERVSPPRHGNDHHHVLARLPSRQWHPQQVSYPPLVDPRLHVRRVSFGGVPRVESREIERHRLASEPPEESLRPHEQVRKGFGNGYGERAYHHATGTVFAHTRRITAIGEVEHVPAS